MTDQQALFRYRLAEAEETLVDARALLESGGSPRSVVNRSYYDTSAAVSIAMNRIIYCNA